MLAWLSLDAKPLSRTANSLLKMVSVAQNTGEELRPGKDLFAGRFYLLHLGDSPVVPDGQSTAEATSVALQGREVVRAYLQNGTWELLNAPERRVLFCDTPGADFWIEGARYAQAVESSGSKGQGSEVSAAPAGEKLVSIPVQDGRFRYPAGARMVVLH